LATFTATLLAQVFNSSKLHLLRGTLVMTRDISALPPSTLIENLIFAGVRTDLPSE
jgi:hypothetical protein